jgi:hypothetical protein
MSLRVSCHEGRIEHHPGDRVEHDLRLVTLRKESPGPAASELASARGEARQLPDPSPPTTWGKGVGQLAFEGEKRGRWRRGRASDRVQDQWRSSQAVRGQSSIFRNQEETVCDGEGEAKETRQPKGGEVEGGGEQRRRTGTGTERAVQLGTGLKVGEAPDRHHKYI